MYHEGKQLFFGEEKVREDVCTWPPMQFNDMYELPNPNWNDVGATAEAFSLWEGIIVQLLHTWY